MANWERKEIALRTMATGHVLTAPVFRCHGRSERPLAYIQANVHGGELQGNAAILALFDLLEKESPRGSIVLVPRVNPVSANQQVGDYVAGVYDFGSGQNFNRGYVNLTGPSRGSSACYVDVDAFAAVHRDATLSEIRDGFREALHGALGAVREGSGPWGIENRLEQSLAIQEMALDADVVLDLHTGDRAPRYLYAPAGTTAATRAFGIPFVLEVPPKFGGALDEAAFVPWNDLSEAFRRIDRTDVRRFVDGFTVELGSMNAFSMAQGVEDARRIASALRYYGVLDGEPDEPPYRIVCCDVGDYRSIYAPAAGLVDQAISPGTPVRKGDLLARMVDPSRCTAMPPRSADAVVEVRAPDDGVVLLFHAFASIPKGARLLSMMTNVRQL
ncbi:MAG: succinylglutamate desuccinylase/aspartoacylase family protein [Acidobacteria bacterium]|nr:succinylglutamate desuccinylase/aspartoacylase family protein [Acidobacteriota bacterium]